MPEQNNSSVSTLIAILSLLVAVILVIFFIVPKTSEVKGLSSDIAGKKQELELGKQKVTAIKEAVKLIASAKKEVQALDVSIPKTPSADEGLVQIQEMAAQSETTITEATIGSVTDGYQDITTTVSGSYANVLSFLEKMQNNLRPIKVANFNLFYNEEIDSITVSLNLSFPYLDQTEELQDSLSSQDEEVSKEAKYGE